MVVGIAVIWRGLRRRRDASAIHRPAPSLGQDQEKRDAADPTLKGLVWCLLLSRFIEGTEVTAHSSLARPTSTDDGKFAASNKTILDASVPRCVEPRARLVEGVIATLRCRAERNRQGDAEPSCYASVSRTRTLLGGWEPRSVTASSRFIG